MSLPTVVPATFLAIMLLACGSEDPAGAAGGGGDRGLGRGGAGGAAEGGGGEPSASASTGEPLPACEGYPEGPWGNVPGTYLPADLVLEGMLEGETARSEVRMGDLRDCDGRTGVHALFFIGAQTSCSVCNAEAPGLDEDLPALRELGIRVVVLMMDGRAEEWRAAYGLEGAAVLADPDRTFYVDGANPFSEMPNGTPLNVVVDPRTGLIVDRDVGSFDRASLYELATRNRGE